MEFKNRVPGSEYAERSTRLWSRRAPLLTSLVTGLSLLLAGCGASAETVRQDATATIEPTVISTPTLTSLPQEKIDTVFLLVLENMDREKVLGPNGLPTLISLYNNPEVASAEQYYNPKGVHPSDKNYNWLESGQANPATDAIHLATLLNRHKIPWRVYSEPLPSPLNVCPLNGVFPDFRDDRVAVLQFKDTTNGGKKDSKDCIEHVRPMSEFKDDLKQGKLSGYIQIIPSNEHNGHDRHDKASMLSTKKFLREIVSTIMDSETYKNGAVLMNIAEEGDGSVSDGPLPAFFAGKRAVNGGLRDTTHYTHSDMLRTIQDIFGVNEKYLGDAANASGLQPLFNVPLRH